jgi:excisionase family DNA binding protein
MRAPLTFVGEKYRKVTAVYPATDNQSCTCKLNLGDMKDTFLTVKELSKYLNIKRKTIYSWVSKAVIPFYRMQGVLRFEKGEIDLWLKKKCKGIEGLFGL